MGDFYQHGLVTTLHQLNNCGLDKLEADLGEFRKQRPLGLVLPSLFSELEGPALSTILDEIARVPYLDQIVIGLDRADEAQYRHALQFFNRLPQRPNVMWHDGPRLRKIDARLREVGLAPDQPGKGRNVWYMFGYILASGRVQAVALHDCDITTYKRDLLARLIYPVANPSFSFKFCKGYYARIANNSINGRVCRLLVTPLIRALKKVGGPNDFLDYLDSFRYALAGEFSLQRDVIEDIRIPSDWGLEMGVLAEMQRYYATSQICQVDIADTYDHKHQSLSTEDRNKGLSKMSSDIAKSLFRKLATQGEVFSSERIRTIKATYYRIALDLVESHHCDATINGLRYDRHAEGNAVELFAENIMRAGHEFIEKSMDPPFMPSWKRVRSAVPEIFDMLIEAVEADTMQYGTAQVVNPALHPNTQRLRQRVESHVEHVYGSEQAGEISERILSAVDLHRKAPAPIEPSSKWNEGDVMLITYGDSIVKSDEVPLETLHRFLNRELKDVVSAVHILPFSPFSSDDGFSVIDYDAVNPALGSWSDIEAVAKDFDVMADLVVNHCSSQSRWFRNFLADRDPGRDYFIVADLEADLSGVVRPRATPLLTPYKTEKSEQHVWTTFSADQVDLNYANPAVLLEMMRILKSYLDHGIRYFRLDAVAYVWKQLGTPCVHLPQTHEIIKLLRLVMENLAPSSVVVTETNVPNRENLSYFGNDNEAHLIYNFSLPPLLINAMLTGSCRHLKTWLMSMPPAKLGRAYLNFIASHDGIGVRPAEGLLDAGELEDLLNTLKLFGGTISTRRMPDGVEKPYEVNISLYDALKGTVADGPDDLQFERFLCAHTVMIGLEGIPAIYIHSMLGTENDHDLAEKTGRHRSVNRHRWSADRLSEHLADETDHHRRVLDEMRRRIRIRRAQPAFHPNATQYTLHLGDAIFAFWRSDLRREQNIFALHNVTDQPQECRLVELNLFATESWRDLLTDTRFDNLESTITLPPYGCAWITNR